MAILARRPLHSAASLQDHTPIADHLLCEKLQTHRQFCHRSSSCITRSHLLVLRNLCGDRPAETMSDKKRRPYLTNQRHKCASNMLSPRLKKRASSGGPAYSWPVDDESGPSLLSQVLRPARLTIRTSGPTTPRVDATMDQNNAKRRRGGTPTLNVHRVFIGDKKLRRWDRRNHR